MYIYLWALRAARSAHPPLPTAPFRKGGARAGLGGLHHKGTGMVKAHWGPGTRSGAVLGSMGYSGD